MSNKPTTSPQEQARILSEALPHMQRYDEEIVVVKYGGHAMGDEQTAREVQRCLNCDVETVFTQNVCIECDACVDICPMDCITFTENGEETELRQRLTAPAPNTTQALYVADNLKTGRVMVKDEDVCLHCGLCAERCPTGAWDMQKFFLDMTHVGDQCRSKA